MRFVGAPGQQTATAAAVARGFSSKGVSELGKESLPEVREKLTGMADALEKYEKENGKFPPSTRCTPGVTPRGAKVPVVSDSADDRSWQLVGVSWKNERTAFRYRFEISDDGAKATLEAHGDLDADEKESTFRIVSRRSPTARSSAASSRSSTRSSEPASGADVEQGGEGGVHAPVRGEHVALADVEHASWERNGQWGTTGQ